jgi:TolB-like protein/DNA-binding winged helix-turn-helix (wHTH) protein/Tfp pilus assembly protein PilF
MATASPNPPTRLIRFGVFELDLRSGELRRSGVKLRLQGQPLQVLIFLLVHSGQGVTRDELRMAVWPANSFGDIDHSLNKAIAHIREVLGDSAETPRYIETLPRIGYRFIASVETISGNSLRVVPDAPPSRSPATNNLARSAIPLVLRAVAILALVGVLFALGYRKLSPPVRPVIRTLAVLPFENLSNDPRQEYFVDGVTDELITILAKNTGLRVTSRTSVMQYKKLHPPLRKIANDLGVDAILEGSVTRSGNRVHVNAQLIHVQSDTNLWAQSYDRDLSDLGALHSELAQSITQEAGLAPAVTSHKLKQINPEAREAYLMGKYYWFGASIKSKEYFQKAIDLQPDYAEAWSGLSHYYGAAGVTGAARPDEVKAQQEATARKAVELDDTLPEAHNALAGTYYFYQWDWQSADRESARAVQLNPSYAEGHHLRAYILLTLGRAAEALAEQKKSMELDPFARPWLMTDALIHARQFDAALKDAQLRIKARPDIASLHEMLSDAYEYKGMLKEASQEWENLLKMQGQDESAQALHHAYERGGFEAVLEWELSSIKKATRSEYVSPIQFADLYARLKRKDETLHYLEAAYQERSPQLVHVQDEPHFDFVHSEPRYLSIIKKMRLPAIQ